MPVAKMNGKLDPNRGKVIQLKTNNYRMQLMDPEKTEYHIYEFQAKVNQAQSIFANIFQVASSAKKGGRGGPPPAVKKESKRKIVAILSRLMNTKFAFDGESLLISPRKLSGFGDMEDREAHIGEERDGARFRATYTVGDKEETAEGELIARKILDTKAVHAYMSGENMENYPQDVIQAIEIFLRTNPAFHAA